MLNAVLSLWIKILIQNDTTEFSVVTMKAPERAKIDSAIFAPYPGAYSLVTLLRAVLTVPVMIGLLRYMRKRNHRIHQNYTRRR